MRIEGAVQGNYYVVGQGGAVMRKYPLDEAKGDKKLRRAIERNGWMPLPE